MAMVVQRDSGHDKSGVNRRDFLRTGATAGAALAVPAFLAACGSSSRPAAKIPASYSGITDLVGKAKSEGQLNLIAITNPDLGYGLQINGFTAKYGIHITDDNPDGSSAEEMTAAKSFKGTSRAPDSFDIGVADAAEAIQEKLLAQYKNAHWNEIPATLKDPNGYWVADVWGRICLAVNRKVVANPPATMADLLKPEYKSQVALRADPRASSTALNGVWACALANGGSLGDIGPGIDFFAKLKKLGNLSPVGYVTATLVEGETPIGFAEDYEVLPDIATAKKAGVTVDCVLTPHDPVFASNLCTQPSAYAAHPYSARLWQEYLLSDEGQINFMKWGCHPARYASMLAAGKIPSQVEAQLLPASAYKGVQIPTPAQCVKAIGVVNARWGSEVLGE